MARKLAFVLALMGLCLATAVYALGLGNIQSDSSLNEPLSARVPLLGVTADEVSSISASLASPEVFERAGVDRPFSLSRLNFEVKQGPDGAYIQVTTKDPVKEPFLDFLVEVSWSRGKLVREYTLLLDPPTYAPGDEAPASQAPAVAADEQQQTQQQAQRPAQETTTTGGGATASGAPELGQVDEVGGAPSVQRYTVQANDTLWEVAQGVRPDGSVTLNQTMLALLRENPDAFINGDMNRLKRGAILRVPERGEIGGIPVAEANAEVRRQIARWQRNRGVAGGTGQDDGAAETAAAPADGQAESSGGELRVIAPEDGAGEQPATSAQGEGAAQLERQVTLLKESNASLESENEDLKAQVEALKREVAQLESRVNVDTGQQLPGVEQTAESQQEAAEQPTEQAQPEAPEEEVAAEEGATEPQAQAETAEETGAETSEATAQSEEPASEQQPAEETAEETAQQPPEQTEPAVTEQPEQAQQPEPQRRAPPIWQDPMVMGLAGAVLLVLLLLIYLVMRRRSAAEAEEAEDLSDEIAQGLEHDEGQEGFAGVFDERKGQAGRDDETFAGLEEEPPELPPESDPLGEAEVYLAYGRYDQAQDVLERGLQREPDNKELRLKMLEVLALTQDRGAFEDQAQQLHSLVDDNDPVWARAREMGREIAPEHPLFAGAAGTGGDDDSDEGEMTFDLPDSGEDETGGGAEPEKAAASSDEFADFDFSFEDSDKQQGGAEESAPADSNDFDLDFDLTDSEEGEAAVSAQQPSDTAEEPAADLEDLEFDLDEPSPENPAGEQGSESAADEGDLSLDFDLDDDSGQSFDSPTRDDSEVTDTAGQDQQDADSLEDFDFGFDEPEEATGPQETEDSEATTRDVDMQSTALDYDLGGTDEASQPAGGDDVDSLDEVSTKLDLARAYLDMGDNEGARALLDEVVEEGNDAQVKEARELIGQAG